MKKLIISMLILFSISGNSQTANTSLAEYWSTVTKVTKLYPTTTGLLFNTAYTNTSSSTCDGGARFFLDKTNPNYNTLSSIIILAFSLDLNVQIHVPAQVASCQPTVDRFNTVK